MKLHKLLRRMTAAAVASAMALSLCAPVLAAAPSLPAPAAEEALLGQENDDAGNASNEFNISKGSITVTVQENGDQQVVVGNAAAVTVAKDTQVVITGTAQRGSSGDYSCITVKRADNATDTANITLNNAKKTSIQIWDSCSLVLTLEGENTLRNGYYGISQKDDDTSSALTIQGDGSLEVSGGFDAIRCNQVTINGGTITVKAGSEYGIFGNLTTISGNAKVKVESDDFYGVSAISGTTKISGNAKVYLTRQKNMSKITADFADTDNGWLLYKDNGTVYSARLGYTAPENITQLDDPANYDRISVANPDSFDLKDGALTVTVNADGSQTVVQGSMSYAYPSDAQIEITSNGVQTRNTITVNGATTGTANITLNGVNISASKAALQTTCPLDLTLVGENTLKSSANYAVYGIDEAALTIKGNGKLYASSDSDSAVYCVGEVAFAEKFTGTLEAETQWNADIVDYYGVGIEAKKVTIANGTFLAEAGIYADNEITISGDAKIRALAVVVPSYGTSSVSGNAKVYLTAQGTNALPSVEGLTTGWLLYKDNGVIYNARTGHAAPTNESVLADPSTYDGISVANPDSFDLKDGALTVTVNADGSQTVVQGSMSYAYPSDAQIEITSNGVQTRNTITVNGATTGTANITLNNVNIHTTANYAMQVDKLTTNLTLEGENTLWGSDRGIGRNERYSLTDSADMKVTIRAKTGNTDKLTAAGDNGGIEAGTLTIESGTVKASGNMPIRTAQDLTINGGIVDAEEGIMVQNGKVAINGGIVDAEEGIIVENGTVSIKDASVRIGTGTLPTGSTVSGSAKVYLSNQTDVSGIDTGKLAANGTGWLIYKDAEGTLQGIPEGYDDLPFDLDDPGSYKDLPGKSDPGTDDPGTDDPGTGDVGGGDGGAGAAVALAVGGAAAVVGGYEIATRVILSNLLPDGAAIPANRGQLAVLVWNAAGRPEPAAAAAFTDVADAETAKAAQWCTEQGLLEAKQDGRFEPNGWTPKFRVIEVWNRAFPQS